MEKMKIEKLEEKMRELEFRIYTLETIPIRGEDGSLKSIKDINKYHVSN